MADEQLYAQAVNEFKTGNRDPALFAKAYALARGDEKAQEFEYIKLRVTQLKTEQFKSTARDMTSAATSQAQRLWPKLLKVALWLFGLWVLALIVIGAFALMHSK